MKPMCMDLKQFQIILQWTQDLVLHKNLVIIQQLKATSSKEKQQQQQQQKETEKSFLGHDMSTFFHLHGKHGTWWDD